MVAVRRQEITQMRMMLRYAITSTCQKQRNMLRMIEQTISLHSPEHIFSKGYSLTLHNGKVVRKASELEQGAVITSVFADSEVQSVVQQ